ncbi:MAG: sialate O-acetylesterase [Bacteroidales bacterium]|jgi:sialate O-acetylesterase|nr:sialate O-acetylesterase [Bacteroidales bacterium]
MKILKNNRTTQLRNKRLKIKGLYIVLIVILSFLATDLTCQIRLPKLVSNGVILQRDTELTIWGWASANETLELNFRNKTYETQADKDGNWSVILPPQEAGGPYEITINASNTINIKNILFGDVWVCSGQSNMVLPMERVKEKYLVEIAHSDNDNIRQFLVPGQYDFKQSHVDFQGGEWVSANPYSVLNFSAVAYFFAKNIYAKYQVPIGLINAAVGGTPVEAWMSEEAIQNFPEAFNELQRFKNDSLIKSINDNDRARSKSWYAELEQKDIGLTEIPRWNEKLVKDKDWETMKIPGSWPDSEDMNGVLWFRKEVHVPKTMAGKPAKLWMGRIVDQDYAYVNGKLIGTTGYQYPPRRYNIPPNVLKEGKNTIALRVINSAGKGEFVLDKPYYLAVKNDTINLSGEWKYNLGATMPPLESQTFVNRKPTGLYNGMIAPLTSYSIKGVIWYQGESNENNPEQYAELFPSLIEDWRQQWNVGDFPFIYVQLANFMKASDIPKNSNWAKLRQAQLNSLAVPNTGMAVAIDLGEWNDIHPLNKEDVGIRLAFQASILAYNKDDNTASSPIPVDAYFQKKNVVITFDNIGNGLIAKSEHCLKHFALSQDGDNYIWAKAKIKDNKVIVWNKKIAFPVAVRYAWADNPKSANLYTIDGLPASPFELRK